MNSPCTAQRRIGMKSVLLSVRRIAASLLVVGSCLSIVGCESTRLSKSLSSMKGVHVVSDYLFYEGRAQAVLDLIGGGQMEIMVSDDSVFHNTDEIYVQRIGRYVITCWYSGQVGVTSSGHNIIALVSQLSTGDEVGTISNLGDVVRLYDEIEKILERLPEHKNREYGKAIVFSQLDPSEQLCARVTLK